MDPFKYVRQMAVEIAAQKKQQAAALEREYLEAQEKATALKTQLDAVRLAGKRVANFTGTDGINPCCPYCINETGQDIPLKGIGGTDTEDLFRCPQCRREIAVPELGSRG